MSSKALHNYASLLHHSHNGSINNEAVPMDFDKKKLSDMFRQFSF